MIVGITYTVITQTVHTIPDAARVWICPAAASAGKTLSFSHSLCVVIIRILTPIVETTALQCALCVGTMRMSGGGIRHTTASGVTTARGYITAAVQHYAHEFFRVEELATGLARVGE